jgi:hypothetical protein
MLETIWPVPLEDIMSFIAYMHGNIAKILSNSLIVIGRRLSNCLYERLTPSKSVLTTNS